MYILGISGGISYPHENLNESMHNSAAALVNDLRSF